MSCGDSCFPWCLRGVWLPSRRGESTWRRNTCIVWRRSRKRDSPLLGIVASEHLSDIGAAVVKELNANFLDYKHDEHSWHIRTEGHKIDICQTPEKEIWGRPDEFFREQSDRTCSSYLHSTTLPERIGQDIAEAKKWVDIVSLWPPDGIFAEKIYKGIRDCAAASLSKSEGEDHVTVRCIFANIPRVPGKGSTLFRCQQTRDAIKDEIMKDARLKAKDPKEIKLKLWVGSWRKGMSWNHAKIIAVDGRVVYCGGHNILEQHYMHSEPCLDLSTRMEGPVAHDAHVFVNQYWTFIAENYRWHHGWCLPNAFPRLRMRVDCSCWPEEGRVSFPDAYEEPWKEPAAYGHREGFKSEAFQDTVISCGRYSALYSSILQRPGWYFGRPKASDMATLRMIQAAKETIKIMVQDFGPGQPCMGWPEGTLCALAEAMQKGVKVQIVLSNPHCYPAQTAHYGETDGWTTCEINASNVYGYGWKREDFLVAVIDSIWANQSRFNQPLNEKTIMVLLSHLSLTTVGIKVNSKFWDDGKKYPVGMHSKAFIVDDKCYYIGSQNLYNCNHTEWGVIVDSKKKGRETGATKQFLTEYWDPMWKNSYSPEDDLTIETSLQVRNAAQGHRCMCKRSTWCCGGSGCLPPPPKQ